MKRVELVKTVEGFGCVLIRHGAKHDWYRNPSTGVLGMATKHMRLRNDAHFSVFPYSGLRSWSYSAAEPRKGRAGRASSGEVETVTPGSICNS